MAVGLEAADVLKLSDEEFPVIAGCWASKGTGEEILAALCRRYNLRLIALTKGADGSLLWTPEGCSLHPGFPAKVADTVGAGDSFTAAVVLGLLNNLSLDTINALANRVAAYVCSQPGGVPPLPREIRGEGNDEPSCNGVALASSVSAWRRTAGDIGRIAIKVRRIAERRDNNEPIRVPLSPIAATATRARVEGSGTSTV